MLHPLGLEFLEALQVDLEKFRGSIEMHFALAFPHIVCTSSTSDPSLPSQHIVRTVLDDERPLLRHLESHKHCE